MSFDLVVLGGLNTDFVVKGDSLPGPGQTVAGGFFQQVPGGKGANQAVAAARLGVSVALVGRIGGDDRGAEMIAHLRGERVDTHLVVRDIAAASGAALVMIAAGGEKQILTAPGANQSLTPLDVQVAAAVIGNAKALLTQLEVPLPAVEAAIGFACAAGVRIVLDPAPPHPVSDDLLAEVDVIRPNASEAEALTGIAVKNKASARRAARALLQRGVGAAIVGAPGGNLLLSNDLELWLPHLEVEAVDATGAGDAFAAAVATRLIAGDTLPQAASFANAAAAFKTTRLGAQAGLPTEAEVRALLTRTIAAGPA